MKIFQSETIGIEQEIQDLRWLNTGEDRHIAELYSLDDNETPLVSITSDMAVGEAATIELVTSPVEKEKGSEIRLRRQAVEAITRILYECAEQEVSFPTCQIKRKGLSLTQTGGGGDSGSREWVVQLASDGSPVSFRLAVSGAPKVGFAQKDYPTTIIRFNSQVSVGIPVEQLGSFLDRFHSPWWKSMTAGGAYYTLPETRLDDPRNPAVDPGFWPSEPNKRAFAETAYNYFMCMLEFAQTSKRHRICLPGEFLEAGEKNAWDVLPRCAPWETARRLLELACVPSEEFLRFTKPAYMKIPVTEKDHQERLDRLLNSPGLTHTTLSGVTIGGRPAAVMELRGPGHVSTFGDFLCPDLFFEEI